MDWDFEMKKIMSLVLALGGSSWASAEVIRSNSKADLCLAVNDEPAAAWRTDRNVEAMLCDGDNHQQFTLVSRQLETGETVLRIEALGQCLEVDSEATEPWTQDNNIQIAACNDSVRQQFEPVAQADGWFSLRSSLDGRCLDIDMNEANGWRTGRNVHLWSCHGEPNQLWKIAIEEPGSPAQVP